MGYYVNPEDQAKEAWLQQNGVKIKYQDVPNFDFSSDHLPVCLVDNGIFTAAGIAFSPEERDYFIKEDGRPKIWYSVPRKLLEPWYKE